MSNKLDTICKYSYENFVSLSEMMRTYPGCQKYISMQKSCHIVTDRWIINNDP